MLDNPRQATELAKVPSEKRVEVVEKATSKGRLTAQSIREVAEGATTREWLTTAPERAKRCPMTPPQIQGYSEAFSLIVWAVGFIVAAVWVAFPFLVLRRLREIQSRLANIEEYHAYEYRRAVGNQEQRLKPAE